MKFVATLLGVTALGVGIGFGVPMSGPADKPQADAASATKPAAGAAAKPGRHLFDYSRVVHAYREDVDEAVRQNLRGMVEAAARGGKAGTLSMSGGAGGSMRLVRTTPEGARITMDFLVRSEGDDALVTARVFVDMASRNGALGYVPAAVADEVDWARFAPKEEIRADIESFVSRIERQASRYRAAMDARQDRWDAEVQDWKKAQRGF